MNKNVTYLFGAGASANSVPTVNVMNNHLKIFNELLIKIDYNGRENYGFEELKRQFGIIVDRLEYFSSIDKYAESLKGNEKALNKLKIAFSIYLILIQTLEKKKLNHY